VTRSRSRTFAVGSGLAACGLAAAVVLSGCGAGQVSQTAMQMPAVNGTNAWVGQVNYGVALRNLHLRAPQTTDYVEPGSTADLLFVAVNGNAETPDRLVSITSDVGRVTVTGNATLPAGGSLLVGTPDGQDAVQMDADAAAEDADVVKATVALSKPITNGLNYDFTFTFEKAGVATVAVPISAGEAPRRDAEPAAAPGGEGEGGGH
jgi:copper(I)-binding protein